MERSKSRNLSTYEYLQILQLEFIVAELRRKIYIKKKDKDFYDRVLIGKEKKIKDICSRNNNLPSIFTSDEIKAKCYLQVFPDYGYPDFQYKNKEQVDEFKPKDLFHYYTLGSDFKVKINGDIKMGVLVTFDDALGVVQLKLKGEHSTRTFTTDSVSRVV